MKLQGKIAKGAVAAAVIAGLTLPAAAASARTSKTERALLGAVLGGVAGAALGNGRTDAIAIGAVGGAALGAVTHNNNRYYDGRRYRSAPVRSYYQPAPRYAPQRSYYDAYGDTRYSYGGGYNTYGGYGYR
jgi:hypothetical protein